jgi:hypothetical protein
MQNFTQAIPSAPACPCPRRWSRGGRRGVGAAHLAMETSDGGGAAGCWRFPPGRGGVRRRPGGGEFTCLHIVEASDGGGAAGSLRASRGGGRRRCNVPAVYSRQRSSPMAAGRWGVESAALDGSVGLVAGLHAPSTNPSLICASAERQRFGFQFFFNFGPVLLDRS